MNQNGKKNIICVGSWAPQKIWKQYLLLFELSCLILTLKLLIIQVHLVM